MSKSVGNVKDPMEIMDLHGVDALRYYLMAEMTLGQDATFTEENFVKRYNSDLANDLGNLASRVLKMIVKNCAGQIPSPGADGPEIATLRTSALDAVTAMEDHLHGMSLDRGVARVIETVREGNRFFDKMAPWKLAKAGETEALGAVLYATAECLRIVSGLLYPVIPEKMTQLRRSLGLAESEIEPHLDTLRTWGGLKAGREIGEITPLFPRIERPKEVKMETPAKKVPEGVATIDIKTFFQTQLKVAQILSAEPVPKADKLLKLQISLGEERRQLVAGIAQHYTAEELVGKLIVIVANLEPAKIRGIESQGMLLAAQDGDAVRLITVDGEMAPGSSVG